MKTSNTAKTLAVCAVWALALPAFSHVALQASAAPAGSRYQAVFQVGHGCEGSATTGLSVQIPAGFQGVRPSAKAGWRVAVQPEKTARPSERGQPAAPEVRTVNWTAASREAALPDGQPGEFVLHGQLPEAPGLLWFKVLQTCDSRRIDWREVPAPGASAKGLKSPAVLLEVTAPGALALAASVSEPAPPPVQVRDAWVRATVPGQQGTGAFMTLLSSTATRLVGVTSPVAGVADVHEMKMDGEVMRMRPLPALDLPAGQPVQLRSGGYHVMLMDLKQPLPAGGTVPLTLLFRDGAGLESRLALTLPVRATAPAADPHSAGAKAGHEDGHRH